ncbi:MAG: pseudouridine synthase [Polyangiales bacterium]|jgi:tRNA pseudouridine65 synthase
MPDIDPSAPRTPQIPTFIDVLYRDDAVVVVDKPSGLSVHRGDDQGSTFALNLTRNAIDQWVYPVHRLDRATSGVLVFALTPDHARALQDSFRARTAHKTYLALVRGAPPERGVIDSPMAKREGGPNVETVTEYETLFVSDVRLSLVEARPRTGRRHQVRRHLRRIDHPIAGDVNYGNGADNRRYRAELGLYRLALHARRLSFMHPGSGERVTFESAVPEDLAGPLRRIGVPTTLFETSTQQIPSGEEQEDP